MRNKAILGPSVRLLLPTLKVATRRLRQGKGKEGSKANR